VNPGDPAETKSTFFHKDLGRAKRAPSGLTGIMLCGKGTDLNKVFHSAQDDAIEPEAHIVLDNNRAGQKRLLDNQLIRVIECMTTGKERDPSTHQAVATNCDPSESVLTKRESEDAFPE
jgi:hypothetical protein